MKQKRRSTSKCSRTECFNILQYRATHNVTVKTSTSWCCDLGHQTRAGPRELLVLPPPWDIYNKFCSTTNSSCGPAQVWRPGSWCTCFYYYIVSSPILEYIKAFNPTAIRGASPILHFSCYIKTLVGSMW